jgi:DNA segregation ATPase FtsK/SpoIIIE, S-DNA-T family
MPAKSKAFKTNKLKQIARKNGKKKKRTNPFKAIGRFFSNRQFHQILGLLLIIISLFLAISFSSYLNTWKADDTLFNMSTYEILFDDGVVARNIMGRLGAVSAHFSMKQGFGIAAFFMLVFLFFAGIKITWRNAKIPLWKIFRFSLIGLLWLPPVLAFFISPSAGSILPGTFGYFVESWLVSLLGKPGTALALFFVLLVILLLSGFFSLFRFSLPAFEFPKKKQKSPQQKTKNNTVVSGDKYNVEDFYVDEDTDDEYSDDQTNTPQKENSHPANVIELDHDKDQIPDPPKNEDQVDFSIENLADISGEKTSPQTDKPKTNIKSRYGVESLYDPRLDLPHFQFPTFDLLNDYGSDRINVQNEELMANKQKIVQTLNHYSIGIQKIKATVGPTVTLYEIIPDPGIRISRIRNLEDDIALSLAALGIRIIAPIPGKGTVGIEVPNQNPGIVSMKSVLMSDKFQNTSYALPFGMGKTISNEVFVADLTKMPHILMAGATGQGKSVGLNAVIASLLYKKHPAELKFVMVDPKKVELTLFSKIERHYLAKLPDSEEAIITDTRKVVRTLNSLGIEMDTRYELLKDAQVRNIKEYNDKFLERKLNPTEGHHFMPYLVLVIDEFADLIMTAGKEIEIPLTRLAQLARAVGIHLIIATQRPSVNIITGSIKANFPARVAFRVISKVDSRTILDSPGADQLIGRGDMLLSTGNDLIRLQCAFIDTPEIEKLTEFIGSQRAYPDAYHLPEFADEQDEHITEFDPSEKDALFEDSARILVQNQQGSTSLLQRKLKIGYNRAGRIIDQLEAAGIVGPFEGSKAREVLIKTEVDLEHFLKGMDDK